MDIDWTVRTDFGYCFGLFIYVEDDSDGIGWGWISNNGWLIEITILNNFNIVNFLRSNCWVFSLDISQSLSYLRNSRNYLIDTVWLDSNLSILIGGLLIDEVLYFEGSCEAIDKCKSLFFFIVEVDELLLICWGWEGSNVFVYISHVLDSNTFKGDFFFCCCLDLSYDISNLSNLCGSSSNQSSRDNTDISNWFLNSNWRIRGNLLSINDSNSLTCLVKESSNLDNLLVLFYYKCFLDEVTELCCLDYTWNNVGQWRYFVGNLLDIYFIFSALDLLDISGCCYCLSCNLIGLLGSNWLLDSLSKGWGLRYFIRTNQT